MMISFDKPIEALKNRGMCFSGPRNARLAGKKGLKGNGSLFFEPLTALEG